MIKKAVKLMMAVYDAFVASDASFEINFVVTARAI
jgi:hypothetical protein